MAEHTVISPPSSPGISPVNLSDCMEDLAKFTISSYLSEGAHGLGCNLQLPREFCYGLLQDDQPLSNINTLEDDSAGVPAYPLYKHLARAIDRSIKSGTFLRRRDSNISIPINESLGEKEKVWEQLIADKGLELSEMVKGVEFELHVQEPYFSQLGAGQKTVEGRCAVGNYNRIAPGSVLLFNKCLLLKVEHVMRYSSFSEMLLVETLSNVLPGVETIEEGVEIYRRFYTEEKEFSNGVLAISVSKPTSQLYICLANLLSGLGCDGVSALLGMVHTAGTVPDALPPPRSSLVLSSMKPLRPNVKGCFLTDAARALAKHVNRSKLRWWGEFSGSDSVKNGLALEVINCLLNQCCWMNVHLIQPHESVFEVRVQEGYGARWSCDGSKFIGFLEPYTEEGYSKGWKN